MANFESPELIDLFTVYTASPTSMGARLAATASQTNSAHPLIVATGTDLALFPGNGAAPTIEAFRLSTRGFKELAAISHLGPALATLIDLREREASQGRPEAWRDDAELLLGTTKAARAANSTELWRERIAVAAFVGREPAIAAMVDYSCALTEGFLSRALDDPSYLTMTSLRQDFLAGPARAPVDLIVPFNRIMIATFFLTGMDIAHRLIAWADAQDVDWPRAMVIVAGKAGRPTAGVTVESNSVAGVILAASREQLPLERLFIAPHAAVFPTYDGTNIEAAARMEPEYRRLWSSLQATSQLGSRMFAGYPRFEPRPLERSRLSADTVTVHEKPAIDAPDDWNAMTTRLRVVMEDPSQLLSGAVTDYASRQLVSNANDPRAVFVPGLDGETYPGRQSFRGVGNE